MTVLYTLFFLVLSKIEMHPRMISIEVQSGYTSNLSDIDKQGRSDGDSDIQIPNQAHPLSEKKRAYPSISWTCKLKVLEQSFSSTRFIRSAAIADVVEECTKIYKETLCKKENVTCNN